MSFLDFTTFSSERWIAEVCDPSFLTEEQLQLAITQNPYWRQKLLDQWAGALLDPNHTEDSPEFAEVVREYQVQHDLEPDGICGPKTNAVARGDLYEAPVGTEYLLINGDHVPCDLKVTSPDEPGALVFDRGFYNEPLLKPTLFVLHWDGCPSSMSCFNVLRGRKLSVLFMLDADATLYQGLDPAKGTCWHAGSVNRRAWGVEICNPVYPQREDKKRPRGLTTMDVRGDKHQILKFYPEQIEAAVKLAHWVCDYAGIPKQLPSHKGRVGVYPSYIQGPGDKWLVNNFSGVCAHFHQDDNKCDPGMLLWQPLIDSGFVVVEV